jgi:hypothetical protein
MSNEMTYPVSPNYVKDWTALRGAAEFVSNALDEDPNATVAYADGVLTISDNGPGIPEEGLILGYSSKGDTDIGQFGEGAKIASLVLARADDIGAIRVETVGYGFVPTLETRNILNGIAPRRSKTPPQVLVYTFFKSERTVGTKVTIECSPDLAAEVIGRFRHLSEPGYRAPVGAADIMFDGEPGRLYIGGVLVSKQPRFLASYDFPLAAAKTAQNRDRTVIENQALTALVSGALAECADPDVIRTFATAALEGRRFSEPEKYFADVTDIRVRSQFRAIGTSMFQGRSVFYAAGGRTDEAALYLQDGDFELLTTSLDQQSHASLMRLLGVEAAARAARTNQVRHANSTKYIALSKLTTEERRTLKEATDLVRSVFGQSALDQVRVYTEAADPALTCAYGFYTPSSKRVSILRTVLGDPRETLATLLHESAHRRAHMRGGEYQDRTRGFESELTSMMTSLTLALASKTTALWPPPADGELEDLEDGPAAAGVVDELVEGTPPAVRVALAELLNDLMPATLQRYGVTGEGKLSDALALHRNYVRLMLRPHPAGWRRSKQSQAPSVVASYPMLEVFATAFSVRPAVLWLGHMLCEGPVYGRSRGAAARGGKWPKRIQESAAAAAAELSTYGGVYAEAGERVRQLAAGELDSTGDVEEWTAFALEVIAAERSRLVPR